MVRYLPTTYDNDLWNFSMADDNKDKLKILAANINEALPDQSHYTMILNNEVKWPINNRNNIHTMIVTFRKDSEFKIESVRISRNSEMIYKISFCSEESNKTCEVDVTENQLDFTFNWHYESDDDVIVENTGDFNDFYASFMGGDLITHIKKLKIKNDPTSPNYVKSKFQLLPEYGMFS